MARRRRSRCATAAYGPAPAEALTVGTGWRKAEATTVTPFPGFDIVAQHAAPNMVATRDEQEGERDERGEFREITRRSTHFAKPLQLDAAKPVRRCVDNRADPKRPVRLTSG